MEEMYTITLSDGSTIEHLRLNGNNFISRVEVTEEDFEGKLREVIISDGKEYEQIMHDAELVQIVNEGAEWWFILRELSDDEKRQRDIELTLFDLQAQTDYIAMMTDVEL